MPWKKQVGPCQLCAITCPLVTKVHLEVERHRKRGREVVMIGYKGHPEVEGSMGQGDGGMHLVESVADVATLKVGVGETAGLVYVTQTTLSMDDAAARAVFNVAFNNRDDHARNFAYRLGRDRRWRLFPCYDLIFSDGPAGDWARHCPETP